MPKGTISPLQEVALGVLTLCWAVPSPAAQRSFLMGTTTGIENFQFAVENPQDKDLLSIHVDDFLGVPWANFRDGTALPPAWVSRWTGLQTQAASSGKVIYLAIGPLDGMRKTLAAAVDANNSRSNNWAPVDADGCYAFAADPNAQAYKRAYMNYAKWAINLMHPAYFSPAIEMNIEFTHCPAEKAAFIQWYSDVHQALKQAYPGLVIYPSFQLDAMYGFSDPRVDWCGGPRTDATLAACFQSRLDEAMTIPADRIAFSTYPAPWKYPPNGSDTYTPQVPYEDIFSRVQRTTRRKIWITETGWPTVQIYTSYQHTTPPSSCGSIDFPVPIIAGEANLADHLSQLLAQAQSKGFEAVIWTENRDILDAATASACPCPGNNATCFTVDQLYLFGGTQIERLYRLFGNMGLRYNDGSPRPLAYSVWASYFNQPYAPASSGVVTLDAAMAYPNPMRPSLGHTGIHFTRLPPGAHLRVYTLAAEKVADLTADTLGQATWDAKTQAGQKAASGVYVVSIQAGGEKKTLKVAVQR